MTAYCVVRMGAVHPATSCCASRCGGQPSVVSINDDARAPLQAFAESETSLEKWEEEIPEWLAALAPGLAAEEASRAATEWTMCAKDLRARTRTFVHNAMEGVQCRLLDKVTGQAPAAKFTLDEARQSVTFEELESTPTATRRRRTTTCLLAEVRNIWVCADSPLARRVHESVLSDEEAEMSCMVLLDAPVDFVGLVLRSSEAREEFLDCMGVLIAGERLRCEPGLARCDLPGGMPPPEAQLRLPGRSLQSVHLSGPICAWLAKVGEHLDAESPGKKQDMLPPYFGDSPTTPIRGEFTTERPKAGRRDMSPI